MSQNQTVLYFLLMPLLGFDLYQIRNLSNTVTVSLIGENEKDINFSTVLKDKIFLTCNTEEAKKSVESVLIHSNKLKSGLIDCDETILEISDWFVPEFSRLINGEVLNLSEHTKLAIITAYIDSADTFFSTIQTLLYPTSAQLKEIADFYKVSVTAVKNVNKESFINNKSVRILI